MSTWRSRLGLVAVVLAALPAGAWAQAHAVHVEARAWASNIIVPQSRTFAVDRTRRVEVTGVEVGVVILEQAATTTMDISLRNPTNARLEAELMVPVPEGAVVRGFSFAGAAKEPTAELLPKDKAIATYKSIVASMRDPALLEFAGYNVIRSSVFPVDAGGTQKVRLTYELLLPADGDRVDYVLPRTEAIDYRVPWEISVKIQAKRPISTVYSSSHKIECSRTGEKVVMVKVGKEGMTEPGPFQLSYLQEGAEGVTASLLAYPDPKIGGGYFLLLAGLPAKVEKTDDEGRPIVKREVTVVIDRSGSMGGEKIKQVKAAALQVVEGLQDGEAFNIIDYSDSISSFAPAPVAKNKDNAEEARRYIRKLTAGGGTNIHDTLIEALRPKPMKDMLPIVLFLTDGLPTVGVRDEATIRNAAAKGNAYNRRIFTFGVGYDVNAPLLTHLARNSRAVSTFVLPNEEIEVKVSQVYCRLFGPVLAGPSLLVVGPDGQGSTRRVADLLPREIPDLFEGDQLVLLGKYKDDQPLRFRLAGDYQGKRKTFQFEFKLDKATTRNNFVPRLWASRKIALLIDEIRQAGATSGASPSVVRPGLATDPKMKELVDEIVRLSLEFGILTEYTAFLAKEGMDLQGRDDILRTATGNLESRAQRDRSGIGAVNQALNNDSQQAQTTGNRFNRFYDQNMNSVQITRVQQINDRAFFRQGNRWVDGSVMNNTVTNNIAQAVKPDEEVKLGSPEFDKLLDKLVEQNRQGSLSMSGEVLLNVDGKNILIKGD